MAFSQAFAIGGDEQALNPEAKRVMMEIMGKVTDHNALDLQHLGSCSCGVLAVPLSVVGAFFLRRGWKQAEKECGQRARHSSAKLLFVELPGRHHMENSLVDR